MCCWQRTTEGPPQYEEKHWLEYGTDYTVTKITDQDTGGKLYLLKPLPPEAEQLVIRRITSKTQEIDLHNGARLTAELIEKTADKLTMQIQEISEQVINKDDKQDILKELNAAVKAIDQYLMNQIATEVTTEISKVIVEEAQARGQGDVNTLNESKYYTDQTAASLNVKIDRAQALKLSGAILTRVINGTTPVAKNLFEPSIVFDADKTLISDINGTVGVYRYGIDSATIIVETMSVSPISANEPTLLGNVATYADLPETVNTAVGRGWNTPRVDDYARVLRDETNGNNTVEYYIENIEDGIINGIITWANPVVINTSDYQAQTAAEDAGKVPICGATPGTWGASKPIDTVPTEDSNNLISSDAVFRHTNKKPADIVIGNVAAGHTANMVNYLCAGAYDEIIINEAMEELRASGGGKILLLKGQYNVSDSIDIIGDNIILQGMGNSTVINIVGSSDPNPTIISMLGDNSQIKELKMKNSITGKSITYGVYNIGDHNVIKNVYFDMGINDITVIYPIYDYGNYTIIKNNTLKFQSNHTIYGIVLHGNNAFVIENIIDIQSNYKAYCIYIWAGNKNTVHDNNISCRVLDYPDKAFALYYQSGDYNSFKGNNLSGITRTSPAGSAFTVDGVHASPIPDSPVGLLGDNGICGFNIGTGSVNRYNVSFKITDGQDYLTFNLSTYTPFFADEISGNATFVNITNAQFIAAMKTYFPALNVANKTVTKGGASGYWAGAYVNHLSFMMVDSTTFRVFLNTSNSAYTFDLTDSTDAQQFAVNVSKSI